MQKDSILKESKNIIILVVLIVSICFFQNCSNLITDPGPQPKYLDNSHYQPLLNILSVLRSDSINGLPLSYIHVEKSFPYASLPDTLEVSDARVTIFDQESDESWDFFRTDKDGNYPTYEYRNLNFVPIAGHTYRVSCVRDGLPELTATTTIPYVPKIEKDRIHISERTVSFSIARDPLVALYDIYLFNQANAYFERIRCPETGNTFVKINTNTSDFSIASLMIYAYDLNFSEYVTYNINIKPNTYRAPYSTVDNGYGCFGSLNRLELSIVNSQLLMKK